MQLLKTGAFLRAARSARLSIPSRRAPLATSYTPSRWSSSQVAAAAHEQNPFPEQSVNASREVDPAKTAELKDDGVQKSDSTNTDSHKQQTTIGGTPYILDQTTNVTSSILGLVGRNLYDQADHPICITRKLIESCFPHPEYNNFTMSDPVVTVKDNFDVLGFPADHPGRSRTDTYYVNSTHLLRTHTSAHQHAAFQTLATEKPTSGYTICADVYRRDSIDRSHFPVFHQMEGARVWDLTPNAESRYLAQTMRTSKIARQLDALPKTSIEVEDNATSFSRNTNPMQSEHDPVEVQLVVSHLKRSLEYLMEQIHKAAQESLDPSARQASGPLKVRWVEAYFPFTSPSFELEVLWNGEWLELLGCGVVQQPILNNAGLKYSIGWAWGVGIERFAMLLFGIPDIRLFWSDDPRFLRQFSRGKITKFEPFSKFPACYKDIAFWINPSPGVASPIGAEAPSTSGVAAAAGGNATKASPSETQPAAFHENDIMEVVRDIAGSLAEDVKLVDEFVHPTSGRKSLCYRINYRSLERTLTNEEVNELHNQVERRMASQFGVELR
ncbi:phenylalanyl-tRNA synthetase alpha subunit, mitochondrial [Exophiala xenobiotica]|nr:phenylalanyl-tRNA synthetase alpha subunit, mitochondrial [Exophiala xenobiotica]KAK5207106.1 phenylalanyl-tRNA synthetase alpha subunit, mitochondrial [Exophiala xenobiotica]KAK5227453.1 phenylalanyl-tRNA synthetase alpha subunit, mitochondrial [Exophiala xenobiotica]KAK5251848.1 phenylalanyl-tRNA synthetase alpha subunit, mitochondrial [Exophiala xenobiotica]KAK5261696.1 phenylalanyl-tRNA synthetase alpha subunit, mitochondrial [Exophiala xenobiotica]